jgi:hypothetical protein
MRKSLLLAVSAVILAALPAYSLYGLRPKLGTSSAVRVSENYVKASYARNFAAAYRWLSSEDQKRTGKEAFAAERGSFTGFTARLATTLADFIEAKPVETAIADSHARIKIKLRVPDPDQLATHLLAWDEERLNLLSVQEQKSLMAKIDRLHIQKKSHSPRAKKRSTWSKRTAIGGFASTQKRTCESKFSSNFPPLRRCR